MRLSTGRAMSPLVHSREILTAVSTAALSSTVQVRVKRTPAYGRPMSGREGEVLKVMDGRTARGIQERGMEHCE